MKNEIFKEMINYLTKEQKEELLKILSDYSRKSSKPSLQESPVFENH